MTTNIRTARIQNAAKITEYNLEKLNNLFAKIKGPLIKNGRYITREGRTYEDNNLVG